MESFFGDPERARVRALIRRIEARFNQDKGDAEAEARARELDAEEFGRRADARGAKSRGR
jgi:hypothetical protein